MNKTDDILERLKGQQPMIDDPDALTDRIMNSLPDLEPSQQEDEGKARIIGWRWPAILAVAASVATALLLVWPKQENHPQEPSVVAQAVTITVQKPSDAPSETVGRTVRKEEKSISQSSLTKKNHQEKAYDRADYLPLPKPVNEPQVHYAAIQNAVDTIYKDPARMDEFIARMADFNEVEAVPLDCNPGSSDSTIVSNAYIFDDTEKFDVFGRLLQAACWYDSKTPGYLLNFSHQQLFFTLKDLRKGQKYLWIAERVNGDRILLYSTHSPIETDVSSSCYQNYREQLTHTIFSSSQF
ncbi:MAG: hypothetical protein IKU49_10235 [Prevotella sp.]|nr:hypothetical protein [Prevotella sp.]